MPHFNPHTVVEFITERKAFVQVGESTSSIFKFQAGCPQGSTLGPKVFNLYCHDLIQNFEEGTCLITYADDSYVVVRAKTTKDLIKRTKSTMSRHLQWLKTNGMICNVDKTEMIVMGE